MIRSSMQQASERAAVLCYYDRNYRCVLNIDFVFIYKYKLRHGIFKTAAEGPNSADFLESFSKDDLASMSFNPSGIGLENLLGSGEENHESVCVLILILLYERNPITHLIILVRHD